MTDRFVTYSRSGVVGTITIDRPKALNALNPTVLAQLGEAMEEAVADKDCGGIIITGAGDKAFVAGADISTMADLPPAEGLSFAEFGLGILQKIEDSPKVVIAAVDGFALGGGMELALACDMIYASDRSRMGQPEVKLGIIPGFGGTQRLARLVGRNRAKEIVFTGAMYEAETAMTFGIVQAVLPSDELLDYCVKMVEKIAAVGPLAVAQAKVAINKGTDLALDAGLAVEKLAFMSLFGTADQKEGMHAFLEKRKPQFKGE